MSRSHFRIRSGPIAPTLPDPFLVIPYTGYGSGYAVQPGVCFSTFSYDTGTFVPIQGFNTSLPFSTNKKIYIEFSISPNLQVTGAQIQCQNVGPDAGYWPGYPSAIEIQPPDIYNSDGTVKTIVDGKRQTKCYALIAYAKSDQYKNNSQNVTLHTVNGGDPVQILNNDIIMMATMVSGVPVIVPFPYYGGTQHLKALQNDINAPTVYPSS
jgi:hypothetical protein